MTRCRECHCPLRSDGTCPTCRPPPSIVLEARSLKAPGASRTRGEIVRQASFRAAPPAEPSALRPSLARPLAASLGPAPHSCDGAAIAGGLIGFFLGALCVANAVGKAAKQTPSREK